MKRIFFIIVFLLAAFINAPPASAVGNPDQNCVDVLGTGLFTYASRWPMVIFKPSYNILDGVSVRIKQSLNDDDAGTVTLEIKDINDNTLGSKTKTITRDDVYWEVFEFDDISVTPDQKYVIKMSTANFEHAEWHATSDTDCYKRGYAADRYTSPLTNKMFGFSTYGRNAAVSQTATAEPLQTSTVEQDPSETNARTDDPEDPGSDSAPPGIPEIPGVVKADPAAPDQPGITPGSKKTPTISTSSISKPSELKATGQDDGSVKLDWKASETIDIDGYKIFRSQDAKDFKEIAKASKTTLAYKDVSPVNNHTNYYLTRAYKASQESADSNVAYVIPVKPSSILWPAIIFAGLLVISLFVLVGGIVIFILVRRKTQVSQPPSRQ